MDKKDLIYETEGSMVAVREASNLIDDASKNIYSVLELFDEAVGTLDDLWKDKSNPYRDKIMSIMDEIGYSQSAVDGIVREFSNVDSRVPLSRLYGLLDEIRDSNDD